MRLKILASNWSLSEKRLPVPKSSSHFATAFVSKLHYFGKKQPNFWKQKTLSGTNESSMNMLTKMFSASEQINFCLFCTLLTNLEMLSSVKD